MSDEQIISDALKITTQTERPTIEEPRFAINIGRIYSTTFCTLIVIFAIISLIVNLKRKSKKRIVLSIVLPIIAVIIKYILGFISLKIAMNGYETSIAIPVLGVIGTLLIIAISIIVMIFKRKKESLRGGE